MNIKATLLAEHSKKQCDAIVHYIGSNPKRFAQLMDLFFAGEYRITQRAAWPMSYCVRKHPDLIKPYFKPLINNLRKPKLHDAVLRNTVRLLQYVEIPRIYHGKLLKICFDFIQSNDVAVAIKAFSISILEKLAREYPEIKSELSLIINERWDRETAAFRSRGKKFRSMH